METCGNHSTVPHFLKDICRSKLGDHHGAADKEDSPDSLSKLCFSIGKSFTNFSGLFSFSIEPIWNLNKKMEQDEAHEPECSHVC